MSPLDLDGDVAARFERVPIRDDITARHIKGLDLSATEAEQIVRLQAQAHEGLGWASEPGAIDHLYWMVRDHPAGGEIAVLERDGEIVGTHFNWREHYRIGDRVWNVRGGGGRAFSPELQGRGLNRPFSQYLTAFVDPETELLFGPFSHELTKRLIAGKRRPLASEILELLLPLDPAQLGLESARVAHAPGRSRTIEAMSRASQRVPRLRLIATQVWRWRRLRSRLQVVRSHRRLNQRGEIGVRDLVNFDDRFSAFLEAATAPFDLVRERTPTYLNWRYCDPRGGQYAILGAVDGGHVLGYLALATMSPTYAVADLITLPDRPDVVDALVDAAIARSQAGQAAGVRCWMAHNHPYLPSLVERGFLRRPQETVFAYEIYKGSEPELAPLAAPELKAHIVLGDTDHT